MKRKMITVVLLLLSAMICIGLGLWIKQTDGYHFETYDDVLDAVAKINRIDAKNLQYLNEKHYQTDDLHLYMVAAKDHTKYYFSVFEEQANQNYQVYYRCSYKETTELKVIRDFKNNITIAHIANPDHKIGAIISNMNTYNAIEDIKIDYHIECYDTSNKAVMLIDDQGEPTENYTQREEDINQRR